MKNFQIVHPTVNAEVSAFHAGSDNHEQIHELVMQTARWLHSKGSSQWGGLLRGEDSHDLAGAISRGDVIMFRQSGIPDLAGSLILQQPSDWDRNLWGLDESNPGTALYLHRLVINRHCAGNGLGSDMMKWIEKGILFSGIDRIRLDCIADNEALDRFYKQCGYTYMGEKDGFSIFEKML